jgi:hypothetical protein
MSIVERLVEAIRNEDIDSFGSIYSVTAVMYEPLLPEPARGRSQIMEGEAALFHAFSDISIVVRNVFESGTVVIAEVILSATNDGPLDLGAGEAQATGRRIEVPMIWSLDLNEGGLVVAEQRLLRHGPNRPTVGVGYGRMMPRPQGNYERTTFDNSSGARAACSIGPSKKPSFATAPLSVGRAGVEPATDHAFAADSDNGGLDVESEGLQGADASSR